MLFRRPTRVSNAAREALAAALRAPIFELIPLKDAVAEARRLQPGSAVSVTASPAKGLEATLALCEDLRNAGFQPVPHLAARAVRDRAHLREILVRLDGTGIQGAFVVGGDAKEAGSYPDALSLLRDMTNLGHSLREIGIAGYPQGHAFIPDEALLEALRAKVPFATYVTTQLCFDPAAITAWIAARRDEGLTLPVRVGLPGVAEPHRLLAITARIGVADTHRFLTKNTHFVTRLLRSGGFYRPDALLEGLGDAIGDPALGIDGVHLYTFNAVGPTEAWRRKFIARLQSGRPELSGTA